MVTYGVSNDLFFSGHTALAVLGALEISRLNVMPLTILATLIAVYEIFVVLVLRAHWTMDVLCGLIAAFAVFWASLAFI